MKIRFWGVRGSFPVSSPHAIRYGGNTPCLEVEAGGRLLVIDAGTGIRALGKELRRRGVREIDLLLSHAHWDHIQGLPHFEPLYCSDIAVTVHALRHPRHSLESILRGQQREPFFPVPLDRLPARLRFVEHEDGESWQVGGARLVCRRLNHPGVAAGWRVEADGRTLAYLCDTDLNGELLLATDLPVAGEEDRLEWLRRMRQGARDLGHRADLLVCDTFFLPEEYDPEWGHSRPEDFLEFAVEAGAGTVYLFHHRPGRSDDDLDGIVASCRARANGQLEVGAAREGLEVAL